MAVRAAGGFAAYANNRQCQLLTIKPSVGMAAMEADPHVSFWDKPVPSFDSEGLPFCRSLDPM